MYFDFTVTRSLRKRLNSTDREGSPALKNGGPTPVKSTSHLGAVTEQGTN